MVSSNMRNLDTGREKLMVPGSMLSIDIHGRERLMLSCKHRQNLNTFHLPSSENC